MNRNETDWISLLQAASRNLEYLEISQNTGVHSLQNLNFDLSNVQTLKLAVNDVAFFTKLLSLCSNNLKDLQVNADYMTTQQIESNLLLPTSIQSLTWHHTNRRTYPTSNSNLCLLLSKCSASLVSLEVNQTAQMIIGPLDNPNIKFHKLKHLTIRCNRFDIFEAFEDSKLESFKLFSEGTFHDNQDLKRFLEIQSKTLKSLNITMRDFNIQDIKNFDLPNYLGL